MYKIFRGFPLVEAYQDLKKAKRLAESQAVARCIKLVIAITIALTLWLLPTEAFGISNLTIIEQRLISIFIFATLMWVFEAVPAWTTSVLIVYCSYLPFQTAVCGCLYKEFRQKSWDKR